MKKICFCAIASLCMIVVACFAFSASAAEIVKSGTCGANGSNLTWTLDGTGVLTISGSEDMKNYTSSSNVPWYSYRRSITDVVIGDSVTTIGNYAFYDCYNLTSVTIPDSVTTIGSYAFSDCDNLATITIGDGVKTIDRYAFNKTAYYNDSSNWENNVLYIGEYLIKANGSLDGVYEIKNNTNCIAEYAFYNCYSLTSVTIPDGITTIGNEMFRYCTKLDSITIPKTVTSISDSSFADCQQLIIYGFTGSTADSYASSNGIPFVSLDGFMPNYIDGGQCGDNAYWELYSNGKMIISGTGDMRGYASNTSITTGSFVREVEIVPGITSVGNYAFHEYFGLTNIIIPDSVTSIGRDAFYDCNSLVNLTIPDSVTSIGNYAFGMCSRLESMTIPDSVTSIGDYAFDRCSSLISINIPTKIKSIDSSVFNYCTSLQTIKIPSSVTSISTTAFEDSPCITIHSTANSYAETFAKANNLPFVASDEGWQPKVFYNGKCGDNLMWQLYQDGRLAISFMNGVTSDAINDYTSSAGPTWNNYASLVRTVDIPAGVTRIGNYAFASLSGLLTVNYGSDESVWKTIEIGSNNSPLNNASFNWGQEPYLNVKFKDVLKTTARVNGKIIPVIINLEEGTTWQELKANLVYSDYTSVIVYNHDGIKITDEDPLSTGYILHHVNKDGSVIEELLISVSGDVTGDSIVNVDDIQNVVAHLAGEDNELNKIAIDKDLNDVLTMEELNTFIATFR